MTIIYKNILNVKNLTQVQLIKYIQDFGVSAGIPSSLKLLYIKSRCKKAGIDMKPTA